LNVLKSHLRITIETLLAKGASQHEIARRTGVDRKTIRRYQSKSPMATGSAEARELGLRAAPGPDRGTGRARPQRDVDLATEAAAMLLRIESAPFHW
jgi:Helix-turn-helix domain